MVERIADAMAFDPTHVFLLRNKDELTVLPELATLLTPMESRDAITWVCRSGRRASPSLSGDGDASEAATGGGAGSCWQLVTSNTAVELLPECFFR